MWPGCRTASHNIVDAAGRDRTHDDPPSNPPALFYGELVATVARDCRIRSCCRA
jgi:hypothetical protein